MEGGHVRVLILFFSFLIQISLYRAVGTLVSDAEE